MSIDDALGTLHADTSPRGNTRRRRSIAVLTGAFAQLGSQGIQWQGNVKGSLEHAYGQPVVRDLNEIEKRIQCLNATDRDAKETIAYEVLDSMSPGWQRHCCSCLRSYDVDPASTTSPGKGFFVIWVQRDLPAISQAMDPQAWAACSPDFFASTYVVKKDTCADGDEVDHSPSPPPVGSPWDAVFFEDFRLSLPSQGGCTDNVIEFKTMLKVDSSDAPTATNGLADYHEVDFDLCNSRKSRVSCTPEQNDGIEKDCGFTFAKPEYPTGTVLTGVKFLQYSTDLGINNWIDVGMRAMIDDIRDEGVCCGSTDPVGDCPCAKPMVVDANLSCP